MKNNKKLKRDYILFIILIILSLFLFLISGNLSIHQKRNQANIYYADKPNPIVTIDFENEDVIINEYQFNDNKYPIVDLDSRTITLLGDFILDGLRQEVIISFDWENKSVKIVEESSRYNVCSKLGESKGFPLICLPNRISIFFSNRERDFYIWEKT